MELVERLKATSSTDDSSIDKNSTSVHSLGPQQEVLMVLPAEGVVFGFFFFGDVVWYLYVLCHFVARSRWWNQPSSPVTMLWIKSSYTSYVSCNCQEILHRWRLCFSSSKRQTSAHKLLDNPKFSPSPATQSTLFHSLLAFSWLSRVDSLWRDHRFIFCCAR